MLSLQGHEHPVLLSLSQNPDYQEPVPLSPRVLCRHRHPFACFPVMLFVVWITSAGALPPSCAARPIIISHSLGIDQRAGESHLRGREGAALLTSARSKERLSLERDTREQGSDDEKCCSSVISVGGTPFCLCFHYTASSYIIHDSYNSIESESEEPSSYPSLFNSENVQSKNKFYLSWSQRSGLVKAARHQYS